MILKNSPVAEPPLGISDLFNNPVDSKDSNLKKITYHGRSLSLSQWSKEFGIPLATLRYRVLAGWTDDEVLGLAQHPRDRTQEQTPQASARANVLVIDDQGVVLSRVEAARRLKVQPRSLAQRLRRFAVPGRQARVKLDQLYAGSRLEQFQTLTDSKK